MKPNSTPATPTQDLTTQTINIKRSPYDSTWIAMFDGDGEWFATSFFGDATFDDVCDRLGQIHPNAFMIEG
jgi:hypothetical protein